ncbi:chemotaxis protein CheW [Alkaliphilus peptidifermentans]|uniref:Chemotaxis signal transduction protein n=1 Tax=Alkaliphilus peptidifermentans DSM 18978 TaxID=1120976 RepID=A0A1G5L8L0_9FIRM|nr:chemotaxis protein CheW [Alkaliphilus peptidifermentans]SCZ09237.1 Chemotaxis signal transduction protein [Alkaliphilus peptidifermentans DSM 18978]
MNNEKKILLDSGTSELEIVEFKIGDSYFGINEAKIKEIIGYSKIVIIPSSYPGIKGIFKPSESVITIVDLSKYFNLQFSKDDGHSLFIITYFNKTVIIFPVDSVIGIHRLSMDKIEKPNGTTCGVEGVVAGIAKNNNKFINILDIEKILIANSDKIEMQIS